MSKRLTLFNYDWLELDEFNHGQKKESLQKLQVVLTADTLLKFQIWKKEVQLVILKVKKHGENE